MITAQAIQALPRQTSKQRAGLAAAHLIGASPVKPSTERTIAMQILRQALEDINPGRLPKSAKCRKRALRVIDDAYAFWRGPGCEHWLGLLAIDIDYAADVIALWYPEVMDPAYPEALWGDA